MPSDKPQSLTNFSLAITFWTYLKWQQSR